MSVQQVNKRHSAPKKLKNKAKEKKSADHSSPHKKIDSKKKRLTKKQKKRGRREQPTQKKPKRMTEKKRTPQKKSWRNGIKRTVVEISVSFVLLGIVLYIASFFTFSMVKVEGYSMIPTLNNGEWVFVNKLAEIKRSKMILYKDPQSKEVSVRRVIGLPGEKIRYTEDKLYINDQEIYERYLEAEIKRAKESKSLYTADWFLKTGIIPDNKYIVLGDNRPYATDSRQYGYIDKKEIVGIVEMRVFPIHQIKQY
ncbi:signal peptidase I [Enterococcus sp. AZ170]|uniref:signal peptidase I n=1 Tax=Enterococcus sp. AZ170 TaxID=2774747 RepID=UPI003D300CB5